MGTINWEADVTFHFTRTYTVVIQFSNIKSLFLSSVIFLAILFLLVQLP